MSRSNGAKILAGIAVLLSIPGMLVAKTLQITWNANTEQDLSGYRVYYGTSSHNYSYVLNVGNTTSVTVDGFLENTTYYVALKAYDYSGYESEFSQEVPVVVPPAADGGGILTKIMSWISSLFGIAQTSNSALADYNLQDFSSMSTQSVAQAMSVVRVGGASSSTPTSIQPAGDSEYVIQDAIAMVAEYFDLSWIYPDGTYLFLPITEDTPYIENNVFSAAAPGAYLYLVADSAGEYLHILRISVLDMMYAYSDYQYGTEMYLEDRDFGISVTMPSLAFEGDTPIAIGQNYADIVEANAQSMSGKVATEFTIAPYGLTLLEPAEVHVAVNGSTVYVECFDEKDKVWKAIPDVRVENGQAVFSAQTLGKFRVYDIEAGGSGSSGDSGGGGGGGGTCFISSCK